MRLYVLVAKNSLVHDIREVLSKLFSFFSPFILLFFSLIGSQGPGVLRRQENLRESRYLGLCVQERTFQDEAVPSICRAGKHDVVVGEFILNLEANQLT